LNIDLTLPNPPVEVTYTSSATLAKTPPQAAAVGKLWRVRCDGVLDEPAMGQPSSYSLEAERRNRLVLRRADGSAVPAFAFFTFGLTSEADREAAEEERLRRRTPGTRIRGGAGRWPRGRSWLRSPSARVRPRSVSAPGRRGRGDHQARMGAHRRPAWGEPPAGEGPLGDGPTERAPLARLEEADAADALAREHFDEAGLEGQIRRARWGRPSRRPRRSREGRPRWRHHGGRTHGGPPAWRGAGPAFSPHGEPARMPALCGRLKTSFETARFEEDGPLLTRKPASEPGQLADFVLQS
jgi:hypothetical protein